RGTAHPVGHHFRLLDNLLDHQLADDTAQVAFHHEPDQSFTLLVRLCEQLLGGCAYRVGITLDLYLGYSLHVHRHALLCIQVLRGGDIERHQFERQHPRALHKGHDDSAATLDDFWHTARAQPVNDHSFVRTNFSEQSGHRRQTHQQDEHQ